MQFTAVACDDGVVRKLGGGLTAVACVSYRELWPVEASIGLIRVDGLDATSVLSGMVSLMARPPGVIMLDSITIGGFNFVSLPALHRLTGLPVVVAYSYMPSLRRLEAPLRQHFSDAELRLRAISLVSNARRVETARGELYLVTWGIGLDEARELVESYQVFTRVPEPIRVAHRLASEASDVLGLQKGASGQEEGQSKAL
ncbi:DUF99 family protein [Acidilobus sp. 7A]|uniref:endonuclease dU n=1 Tax=Acidilobus sp. 7A TaxID=1577685 RepID=UPI000E3EC834|nr:DUF99 family protein [Acidilobus sp. 7A]